MQALVPFVWMDGTVEEALEHYSRAFSRFEVLQTMRHLDETVGNPGDVLLVTVRLAGQEVMFLNGGPDYAMPGNVSLYYKCADQAEIDRCWEVLGEGGEHLPCGWLKDRFGVLWQIQPAELDGMLADPDQARVLRVLHAVWGMSKMDLATLRAAYGE